MIDIKSCPLCGSKKRKEFYNFGANPTGSKIEVKNVICEECHLVFQSPMMSEKEMEEYYSEYLQTTQELFDISIGFEEHIAAISKQRYSFIEPYINKGDSVLDIGCSFGSMLNELKNKNIDLSLTGVNPEEMVAQFGKKYYGLDIRINMFENENFESESFDFIILDNVIEHFSDIKKVLEEIHRVLKENGKLFIVTNDVNNVHGEYFRNFFLDHSVTFSQDTLRMQLESEGFFIDKIDSKGHFTFQGYHYPYIQAVVVKGTKDKSYTFIPEDKLEQVLDKKEKYIEKFNDDKVFNHTLPSKEYFKKRFIIALCKTEQDEEFIRTFKDENGFNCFYQIVQRKNNKFIFKGIPKNLYNNYKGQDFDTFEELALFVKDNIELDELIVLKLNNSKLPSNFFKKYYQKYIKKDKGYAAIDFKQFTRAKIEIIDKSFFEKIDMKNDFCIDIKKDMNSYVLWPMDEDVLYYHEENFDEFYNYPKSISLDLNPGCNKVCPKCQFHSNISPFKELINRKEIMELKLVEKIFKEVSTWENKPSIAPTFSGEPLLYPYFEKFLSLAKEYGLIVSITTNGRLLIDRNIELINKYENVSSVIVSLDANTEETYKVLQPPGNLEEIKRNTMKLMNTKRDKLQVGMHFVSNKLNVEEEEGFKDFWIDKVDFISYGLEQDQFGLCNTILPTHFTLGKRFGCFAAWGSMYVRYNGELSVCGFDITSSEISLNANETSLYDIWHSKDYKTWRHKQSHSKGNDMFCKSCPDWAGMKSVDLSEENMTINATPISYFYKKVN